MLKITNTNTGTEQRWTVHGQLTGPWVAELKSNWEKLRPEAQGRRCVVDLTDVTFIDEGGETVLCAMRKEGAEFVARGVDTQQLLADLATRSERPLRKCLSHLTKKVISK
jgi:anti-anti-sigma regulatory factor